MLIVPVQGKGNRSDHHNNNHKKGDSSPKHGWDESESESTVVCSRPWSVLDGTVSH